MNTNEEDAYDARVRAIQSKLPDIEYHMMFNDSAYLPPVPGLPTDWLDPDEAPTIEQVIDDCLDKGQTNIVKELARHLV